MIEPLVLVSISRSSVGTRGVSSHIMRSRIMTGIIRSVIIV